MDAFNSIKILRMLKEKIGHFNNKKVTTAVFNFPIKHQKQFILVTKKIL